MSIAAIAGALANKPSNGGEAWVRLSWVLGLRRLGFDVWLVEQIAAEACHTEHREWFETVVDRFGLRGRAALVEPDGHLVAGAQSAALEQALAEADLLVNISGNLTCERLFRLPRRRAYLDLDPGYTQFWHTSGALGSSLERHDHFLTVALAIGEPSCSLPTDGIRWVPIAPPVILDDWAAAPGGEEPRFTTVGSWRGGYGRVEHEGRVYGQKAHEWRRFTDVPHGVDATFEAALDIHPADETDVDRLENGGWKLVDPIAAAGDPDSFRRYVQGSTAELSSAQGIYVETGSGWFSDRTTRYLASGKPAVVQDTGLPPAIPRGEGLLSFKTAEEAVAAARTVLDDYERHSRAARQIAEEHFASDKVLGAVLEGILV